MARWLVERPGQIRWTDGFTGTQLEDVGATCFALHESGALVFGEPEDEHFRVYAPGQWLTVVPAAE